MRRGSWVGGVYERSWRVVRGRDEVVSVGLGGGDRRKGEFDAAALTRCAWSPVCQSIADVRRVPFRRSRTVSVVIVVASHIIYYVLAHTIFNILNLISG